MAAGCYTGAPLDGALAFSHIHRHESSMHSYTSTVDTIRPLQTGQRTSNALIKVIYTTITSYMISILLTMHTKVVSCFWKKVWKRKKKRTSSRMPHQPDRNLHERNKKELRATNTPKTPTKPSQSYARGQNENAKSRVIPYHTIPYHTDPSVHPSILIPQFENKILISCFTYPTGTPQPTHQPAHPRHPIPTKKPKQRKRSHQPTSKPSSTHPDKTS
jgi:hypothetical protein